MFDFNQKRVLITQNSLHKIAGSEVNTLELSRYFTESGAGVTVYTPYANNPMLDFFRQDERIDLVVADDSKGLNIYDFDLIWVHQEVLPEHFFDQLDETRTLPIVICFHMSKVVSLELPYVYRFEDLFASQILYVSEETRGEQQKYLNSDGLVPTEIFPNPVPTDYLNVPRLDYRKNPGRILVVSNHPPVEVEGLASVLNKKGIKVVFRGESPRGEPKLITPQELLEYDCVITIGKTVQYCLVLGVPVFVYDQFGGPGYLSAENYHKSMSHNFSGRPFQRYSTKELQDMVLGGYSDAIAFHEKGRKRFTENFSMDRLCKNLLNTAKGKQTPSIEPDYREYLKLSQRMVSESVINQNNAIGYLQRKDEEIRRLASNADDAEKRLKHTQNELDSLRMTNERRLYRWARAFYAKFPR